MSKINGYSFRDSPIKSQMRGELIRHAHNLLSRRRSVEAFTLPADKLTFEAQMVEQLGKKISFTGVEKDRGVYKKALQKIKALDLNFSLSNCMDTDFWAKNKKEFDFIWLDYCGPWSPSKQMALSDIARGNHVKLSKTHSPLIALTVMDGMDFITIDELMLVTGSKKVIRQPADHLMLKARLGGIPMVINEEAKKAGNSLVPVHMYRYVDKTSNKLATPMILFVCALEKGVKKYDFWKTPGTTLVSDDIMGLTKSRTDKISESPLS